MYKISSITYPSKNSISKNSKTIISKKNLFPSTLAQTPNQLKKILINALLLPFPIIR